MPIIRFSADSANFNEPEENTSIARYFDIVKFLSLIKEKKVFFSRVDKQEDKYEGTLPVPTSEYLYDYYYNFYHSGIPGYEPLSKKEIEIKVRERLESISSLRSLFCINSWNKFEGESYALWKIYSDLNKGILIKSSYKRIIEAFRNTNEEIYCSSINYIDRNKDIINFVDSFSPFIHKHSAYIYEEEIRLIYIPPHENWRFDWGKEKNSNGLMIKTNLNSLIEEIIISPYSPQWFKEIIEDLLIKYGLESIPLKSSSLV